MCFSACWMGERMSPQVTAETFPRALAMYVVNLFQIRCMCEQECGLPPTLPPWTLCKFISCFISCRGYLINDMDLLDVVRFHLRSSTIAQTNVWWMNATAWRLTSCARAAVSTRGFGISHSLQKPATQLKTRIITRTCFRRAEVLLIYPWGWVLLCFIFFKILITCCEMLAVG